MTTSGNVTFSSTRNGIVESALRLLGQMAEGESPTAQQMLDGSYSLNRMIKSWEAQDLHLWKYGEAILFLETGQTSYQIGGGSTDHVTETYVDTELSVAAVATDLTITVDDDTGILNGDIIGIQLDDGTYHWTTVNGVPAANVVTLLVAIPSDAAIGNNIYAYTVALPFPEHITQARRFDDTADINNPLDVEINIVGRQEYFMLTDKTSQGVPVQIYHDKQLDYGRILVWPSPDSIDSKVKFTFQRQAQVFDSANDNPDFPDEWVEALTYNLATRMAPEYGVTMEERAWLKQEATEYLNNVLMYDREPLSIFLQPNTTG